MTTNETNNANQAGSATLCIGLLVALGNLPAEAASPSGDAIAYVAGQLLRELPGILGVAANLLGGWLAGVANLAVYIEWAASFETWMRFLARTI